MPWSSNGVAEGRRGAAIKEEQFASVAAALQHIRGDWTMFRDRSPSLWDKATHRPIFDREDVFRRMEP